QARSAISATRFTAHFIAGRIVWLKMDLTGAIGGVLYGQPSRAARLSTKSALIRATLRLGARRGTRFCFSTRCSRLILQDCDHRYHQTVHTVVFLLDHPSHERRGA